MSLSESIDGATGRLQAAEELLTDIRNELIRIRGEARESTHRLFCTSCPTTVEISLGQALRDGWICVTDDEGNEQGDFAGHCPKCSDSIEGKAEVVSCAGGCDDSCDSLAEAVKKGWSRLTHDPGGLSWTWLGVCPECQAEQEKSPAETQSPPVSPSTKGSGRLFE